MMKESNFSFFSQTSYVSSQKGDKIVRWAILTGSSWKISITRHERKEGRVEATKISCHEFFKSVPNFYVDNLLNIIVVHMGLKTGWKFSCR